jgi:predicted amino acid racemase
MLQLDYALLCDYVRAEGGIAHVIAAGIDTINRPEVPTVANFGLFGRVTFTDEDVGQAHQIEVRLADQEGEEIAHISGGQQLQAVQGLPEGWPYGAILALNFGVPLPSFGTYTRVPQLVVTCPLEFEG